MHAVDGTDDAEVFTGVATTSRSARAFVTAALGTKVSDATVDTVRLIASELVTNALQHGGAQEVEIVLRPVDGVIDLVVTGGVAAPAGLPDPAHWAVAAPSATTGRGLGIVAALAEHIELGTRDGMLVVHCRVRR